MERAAVRSPHEGQDLWLQGWLSDVVEWTIIAQRHWFKIGIIAPGKEVGKKADKVDSVGMWPERLPQEAFRGEVGSRYSSSSRAR